MGITKIAFCICAHDGQDALHGKGKRVFNAKASVAGTKSSSQKWTCTVCGREKGE